MNRYVVYFTYPNGTPDAAIIAGVNETNAIANFQELPEFKGCQVTDIEEFDESLTFSAL